MNELKLALGAMEFGTRIDESSGRAYLRWSSA